MKTLTFLLFAVILSASINSNNGNAKTDKIQGLDVYVFSTPLQDYKIRIDVWSYVSGGDFTYREYSESTGRSLLYRLVAEGTLNDSYLPSIPPYCQALIEKL